jgi:hypothetical protein
MVWPSGAIQYQSSNSGSGRYHKLPDRLFSVYLKRKTREILKSKKGDNLRVSNSETVNASDSGQVPGGS